MAEVVAETELDDSGWNGEFSIASVMMDLGVL